MNKYLSLVIFKKIAIVGLFIWSITVSVLLVRNEPKTVLIGIDDTGTRIIKDEADRMLEKEKVNVIKQFIRLSYQYTSDEYNEKITAAGDVMSDKLWENKKLEYLNINNNIKGQDITQTFLLEDIRKVNDVTFECDIEVTVISKLKEEKSKLKLDIVIKPHKRTNTNPYAWEVDNYAETQRAN